MSRSRCVNETRVGHSGASIRWCSECGDFHLSLGFVQISLTSDQFTHLHSLVNETMQQVFRQRSQTQAQSEKKVEEEADSKPRLH